jgi:hypothetical protein
MHAALRIIRLHFLPRLEVFIVIVEREGHGAIRPAAIGEVTISFFIGATRPAAHFFTVADLELVEGGHQIAHEGVELFAVMPMPAWLLFMSSL